MGLRSAGQLLALPVAHQGIDLGRAVDVLLDLDAGRALGREILCGDAAAGNGDGQRALVASRCRACICARLSRSRAAAPVAYVRMLSNRARITSPVVIQHHSFAFFEAFAAPSRSPAASLLFTCAANTIATTPGMAPTTQHGRTPGSCSRWPRRSTARSTSPSFT